MKSLFGMYNYLAFLESCFIQGVYHRWYALTFVASLAMGLATNYTAVSLVQRRCL
jgi:hypothetical protein